jgi:Domain of unknown function (DUF4157)
MFRHVVARPPARSADVALAGGGPGPDAVARAIQLQRVVGNQAVQGLLAAESQLRLGAVDHPRERAADRHAEQITRLPRSAARCGSAGRPADREGGPLPATVQEALRSPGQPLDAAMQAFFGTGFGRGFAHVRVHTGPLAERSARDIHANAYTVGSDIVFGAGRFAPETPEGRRLIAHELAHVAQHGAEPLSTAGLVQREPSDTGGEVAPRKIDVENVHRLGLAHLLWERSQSFSPDDLGTFAPVEIVTGHWQLRSERYDLMLSLHGLGPHVIELGDVPVNAVPFFFVSWDEFRAEYAIRLETAKARMRACTAGHSRSLFGAIAGDESPRSLRPSEVACVDEVLADVAPQEYARKQRGYSYMARGMAAGEPAMTGGNPVEMGALVFAHNVLGWEPERAAAFASVVATGVSLAGRRYVKGVIKTQNAETLKDQSPFVPAGRDPVPGPAGNRPRSADQLITGRTVPQVVTVPPAGGQAQGLTGPTFVPEKESIIALVDKDGNVLTQAWATGMKSHPQLVDDYMKQIKGPMPEGYLGVAVIKEDGEIHGTLSPNVGPRRGGLVPPHILEALRRQFK